MNNRTIIALLIISSLLNLLFLLLGTVFIARKGGISYLYQKITNLMNATDFSKTPSNPYYLHKKSQFEILPKSKSAIIFLGDSITDEGEWAELLGNPYIKNRGISGDTTDRILNRLDAIVEEKPKQIFLMVGINDLINEGKSPEATLERYQQILRKFQNHTPNTEVLIQSVLPVNNKVNRYWVANEQVMKINFGLQELAKEFSYQYIDVYSNLLDAGNQLDAKYTVDGLHLNGQAYLVWKGVIKKYVN